MTNPNTMEITNKYVQGTIWQWDNNRERKVGVQADSRPVLIISNNTFNYYSPSVNCISITSVLKDSPVHVPVYVSTDSHIQCEQLHTIPKNELTEFMGIVSAPILASVKDKLRFQFDLAEDKDTQLLMSIKRSVDELRKKSEPEIIGKIDDKLNKLLEQANKGFGLPAIEEDFLKLMIELHKQFDKITADVEKLKSTDNQSTEKSEISPTVTLIAEQIPVAKTENHIEPIVEEDATIDKSGRKTYSEADKRFIADGSNSLATLVEKFGFENKKAASNKRNYFRNELGISKKSDSDNTSETISESEAKANPPKSGRRIYSKEDKAFIADNSNTIEAIMERFGYDRATAHKMRSLFRKQLGSNVERPDKTTEKKASSKDTKKKVHNKYTDGDKRFILDETNSLEAIMVKYGFKDRQAAYKARAYIKKISVKHNSNKEGKAKKVYFSPSLLYCKPLTFQNSFDKHFIWVTRKFSFISD